MKTIGKVPHPWGAQHHASHVCDCLTRLLQVLPMLSSNVTNYGYFIGPGATHGRTDSAHMYSTKAQVDARCLVWSCGRVVEVWMGSGVGCCVER